MLEVFEGESISLGVPKKAAADAGKYMKGASILAALGSGSFAIPGTI